MVGFLQRGGYSSRWRLLWHWAHIEAKRARQLLEQSEPGYRGIFRVRYGIFRVYGYFSNLVISMVIINTLLCNFI